MSALLDRTEKTVVATTDQENAQARALVARLREKTNDSLSLALKNGSGETVEVPAELTALLGKVVEAMGRGATITIGTLPKELTTTTAAKMLGISRPTLMQLIAKNELPAHKVGSHTRVFTQDVHNYRDARAVMRRQGLDELRAFEDELGAED
ncbi:helix-turn-helix domain-containing protein [Paenarthrobacter sp. PAE-2]|uniref:helix-turn-helix domain-containing protein n=1 Tax=Paenarthrobacter sp. PAE-2 TaxID=2982532 RepID=UPI002230E2CD|nr:helix-turn-helix domain-containing protein [Paenarthrobacter sp. PAE-2]MCW3767961.1 helix-turn-helix domain-containing protein [Paenarthrobacter sp. PAE-2]